MEKGKVKAYIFTKMVINMKGILKEEKKKEKENILILMEIYMKGHG